MSNDLTSWRGTALPPPYIFREGGVWGDDPEAGLFRISHSPLVVAALSRTAENLTWHCNIVFADRDGRDHSLHVPNSDIHCTPHRVIRRVLDAGFALAPGMAKHLGRYLQSFAPSVRQLHVSRAGWVEGVTLAFVLPGGTIVGDVGGQEVIFHAR